MAKRTMTDSELSAFSEEHLSYEVDNFLACAAVLVFEGQKYNAHIRNALIESFTLHARSVLSFLYNDRPREDDAHAQEFLKAGLVWTEIRRPIPDSLANLKRRVDKEIAHLTYARMEVNGEDKAWHLPPIIVDFIPVLDRFFGNSDPAKLHPKAFEVGNEWMRVFLNAGVIGRVPATGK